MMHADDSSSPNDTVIAIQEAQRPTENDGKPTAQPLSRTPLGPVRKNGMERPYSSDQVIACTGHLVSAVCLYVAAGALLLHQSVSQVQGIRSLTIVMLTLHIPTMLLLVASWISCERIDPARPVGETLANGWLGFKLTGPRWEKARYCAVCRKAVPGLDHHCTWLQTCVGQSNYAQFFTIACTGTIQFVSQALYASLCLVWLDLPYEVESDARIRMQGLLVAILLISVPCTLMYFILLGFHVYLYLLGYGTYEWMLRRRHEQRARADARSGKSASDREASTHSTRRDTDEHSSRVSSVGSANEFMSADTACKTGLPSSKEVIAL